MLNPFDFGITVDLIKSRWYGRREYINDFKFTVLRYIPLLLLPYNETRHPPPILLFTIADDFRDTHIMEYSNFLRWLAGNDIENEDLPARVAYCFDDYTDHFYYALSISRDLYSATELKRLLSDDDSKVLERILNEAREISRKTYINDFCSRVRDCLKTRYRIRAIIQGRIQK